MIALIGYQFAEFRRTRHWAGVLGGYLVYLVLFYLRTSRNQPGAFGPGAIGVLTVSIGLGCTLAASQDRPRWQILVVAAGGRDRAVLSRLLLAFVMVIPLAALGMLTAASHQLVTDPVASLIAALLLYLVAGLIGCLLGTELGRRLSVRYSVAVTVLVCLTFLLAS